MHVISVTRMVHPENEVYISLVYNLVPPFVYLMGMSMIRYLLHTRQIRSKAWYGGFHKCGYPNSWTVCNGNPSMNWWWLGVPLFMETSTLLFLSWKHSSNWSNWATRNGFRQIRGFFLKQRVFWIRCAGSPEITS